MNSDTILIKDPHLAFLYEEVAKMVFTDFEIRISIPRYGIDAIVPQYLLYVYDLQQEVGPFQTPETFLEGIRSWYTEHPIEYEEEKKVSPAEEVLGQLMERCYDEHTKRSAEGGVHPDELGGVHDVSEKVLLQEGLGTEVTDW